MTEATKPGWSIATIPQIISENGVYVDGDWVESKDQDPNGEVRLIQLADIGIGDFRDKSARFLTLERAQALRCTFLKAGDILVARMPDPLGRACIFPLTGKFVTVVDVAIIRTGANGVDRRWLMHIINSPVIQGDIFNLASGSTRLRISRGNLSTIALPIPPLAEQKRIVAKLDEGFKHLETLKAKLERIPELLKKFRQTVLTHAVTGKLTEEWRKGRELESVLGRIAQNRQKHYQSSLETAMRNASKKPRKPDETPYEQFELNNRYSFPASWEKANLKNIADFITDGEHATPKRTDSGHYLLSARNVQDGWISLEKVDYVPDDEYERIKLRCNPEPYDVLISCSGTVGRVSVVPSDLKFVMVRSAALLKLQSNPDISQYVEFALRSEVGQSQILNLQKSTAQANIFIGPMGKIVIPLPSSEEIDEITSQVKSLFSQLDLITVKYKALKNKIDKLPQALLAKAFRGELVSQDVTDEPASILLQRLKEAKTLTSKVKKLYKAVEEEEREMSMVAED